MVSHGEGRPRTVCDLAPRSRWPLYSLSLGLGSQSDMPFFRYSVRMARAPSPAYPINPP